MSERVASPPGGTKAEGTSFPMASVGKHTLVYGLGIVMNKGLAFLMLPLYTRVLTPADYGVMGLIQMTLDVVGILAGYKIVQGIYRFYHKASTRRERDEVVSTALLSLAVSFAAVAAAAFLAAGLLSTLVFGSPARAGLIRLAAGALAFESLMAVALAYARVRDRSVLFVTAGGIKLLLSAILNLVFLLGMGMGVAGVFLSALISGALVGVALAAWVVREVGSRFSPSTFRDLARYGVPLVAMNIAAFVTTFGDRYFLQVAAGEHEVGLYHLAYKFGFLLIMVGHMPFTQVWEPKRFEIWDRPDRDELLARGFVYLNVLLLTVAVGIGLFVDPVLRVLSDPEFLPAAVLVPAILAVYVLQSWTRIQDIGILIRERTEFVTLAEWVGAAVALAAYVLLIPRYLAWGAVAATALAFLVRYALVYRFSQRMARVEYRWGPVCRLGALAAAAVGAGILLPADMSLWSSVAARAGLLAAYLLLLWHGGVLTREERDGAGRFVRRVLGGARERLPLSLGVGS